METESSDKVEIFIYGAEGVLRQLMKTIAKLEEKLEKLDADMMA